MERQTHRAAQEALDTAMTVLKAGGGFGVYPEGTRSKDGRLARGKTGVAWLALTADCPVVPVGITGTDRIQPIGARYWRPHRFSVTFGEPLTFPEHRGQGRQRPGPAGGHRPDHGGDRGPDRPGEGRLVTVRRERASAVGEQRPDVVRPRGRPAVVEAT